MLKSLTLISVALLGPCAALAQGNNCANREQVIERLADGYGETRQAVGLAANNAVVEVYASLETGSWTITVTRPNGITCLVASGQAYESVAERLIPGVDG